MMSVVTKWPRPWLEVNRLRPRRRSSASLRVNLLTPRVWVSSRTDGNLLPGAHSPFSMAWLNASTNLLHLGCASPKGDGGYKHAASLSLLVILPVK